MSKVYFAIAVAVAVFVGATSSRAAIVLDDNFDSYANQAAFEAAWPSIGTTATVALKSAQLSTAQATSVPNSVFVPVSTSATTSATEYRNRRSFTETGTVNAATQIVWSFDYFDTTPAGSPQRNFANLQDTIAPTATNQLVSMGLNSNQTGGNSGGQFYMARILGYTVPTTADPDGGPAETVGGAGAYFKLNDFAVGARSAGWHNLKVILSTDDGLSTDYNFYVDGVLAETVSNIGTAASIRSYDNIAIGSGLTNGGVNAYFDGMLLQVVPEPSSLALIGVGALLLRRRRAA